MTIKKSAGDAATSHDAVNENVTEHARKGHAFSITDFVPYGKAKAVKMSELAAAMHTSEREVRKIIHDARCNGAVICSDNDGYCISETQKDLLPYYSVARKRSISGLKSLKAAKRKLEEFKGQQEISGGVYNG